MSNTDRLNTALADRYRIERELGQGGMATVYLAEDLKHQRKVAVKVLRPELAAVLGADRFVQEIKTTASLQHPHILPLFDSGEADGFLYYVMPYIEGETLRDKLNRETQLGIEEAVRITIEVADALDYAHRHGVIHRDIKPENILLHDGRPMVADFGIALAVSAAAGGRMTETGLSLGTPHYMSPEQATAEKDLTNRSDIYSLGAVLYEMLSGSPPHLGSTAQQIIMRIVTDTARPIAELRKSVPPNVAAAVAQALEKLPADRFDSARAFVDALRDPHHRSAAATPEGMAPATLGPWLRSSLSRLTLGAVIVFAILWLTSIVSDREIPQTSEAVVAFELMESPTFEPMVFDLADDGSLVIALGDSILVRRPGELTETVIVDQGQSSGTPIKLSPDGRNLVYASFSPTPRLNRISLEGGSPLAIWSPVDAAGVVPLAWSEDGLIFFSYTVRGDVGFHLGRVRESGDDFEAIADGQFGHVAFLPGGRLLACRLDGTASEVVALDLATGGTTLVLPDACSVRWSPTGHLLAPAPNGTLRAFPFDPRRLEVIGQPSVVLDNIAVTPYGVAIYDVGGGALLYLQGSFGISTLGNQFAFLDLEGTQTALPLPPTDHPDAAISPDGRLLAYTREGDIWIYDLNLGTHEQFTTIGRDHHNPVWSPDGTRLAYYSVRSEGSNTGVYVRALSGDSTATYLGTSGLAISPSQWLPDGTILATVQTGDDVDIVSLRADQPGPVTEILHADWTEALPMVSPDERWIAYQSEESGHLQLMVRNWPGLDRKTVIADRVTFGVTPRWSRDGRTLYYVNGPRVMAAGLTGTDSLHVVSSRILADSLIGPVVAERHPDGHRLLITSVPREREPALRLVAITGWRTLLRQRLGGEH